MNEQSKPRTGVVNGRLWGARARDWAQLQEPQCRAVYERALELAHVTTGTRYLDVGCGAGLAVQLAAQRGAHVVDVDAPWHYPDLATALRALGSSGVAARAAEHSSEATIDNAHREALGPFRRSDGSYRVGATFRCLLCRA